MDAALNGMLNDVNLEGKFANIFRLTTTIRLECEKIFLKISFSIRQNYSSVGRRKQ